MSIDVSLVAHLLFHDPIIVWLYDTTPRKMMTENV